MTWNEAKSLDESLASLDSFFVTPPAIAEILNGGLTNRCWKVTASDGKKYVWRSLSQHAYPFGISRERENQLLSSLRECHFAPDPVYLNRTGLLVEWLEGSVGDYPLSENEVIGTISKIHSVNIHNKAIPLFSYTAKVDGYWHKLDPEFKTAERHALYMKWREAPSLPPVEPTLCHFDLGDYNIVRTEKGLKVIDWEYAGVGDPRMDLAMTIELARLDMPRNVANYCKLRQLEEVDDWILGVNQWKPRNQMMAMLWYLLGYQIWKEEHYLSEADLIFRQLNR